MSLIQTPTPEAKKVKVTHRLNDALLYKVRRYAEFIRAKNDYVITEALNYFFSQDTEFTEWLAAHPASASDTHKRERGKGSCAGAERVRAIPPTTKPNGATAANASTESPSAGGTI